MKHLRSFLVTESWKNSPFDTEKQGKLVIQMVKCLSAMQESRVQSLGWEDTLEKEMATHPSTLA